MTNDREDATLSSQEISILAEVDSRLFGFLKLNQPDQSRKKALIQKAVLYLEKIIIQAQQTREKKRLLLQKQNSEKGTLQNDPQLEIDPKAFCKLGHFHLLLEDYIKALSAYQKFFSMKEDYWRDAPFLYGLGLVYFHFSAFQCARLARRFSRHQLRILAQFLSLECHLQSRTHSTWVRPLFRLRERLGQFHTLVPELRDSDPAAYFNFFRMTPEMFNHLETLVHDDIYHQCTTYRDSISTHERLAITLRYLASGDQQISLSYNFRVGRQSVSRIIRQTCDAIWTNLMPSVIPTPSQDKWKAVAKDFWNLWQFPHCTGAIDGKHVHIQAPGNSGSEFYNYKGTFSIVLLALCDANYNFLVVDIGDSGSQSDGGVFAASDLGQSLMTGELQLPCATPLAPNHPEVVPHYIIGDAAFPLKTYLMRPYPGRGLDARKTIYNYRLSRARRTIENSFGILCSRFRILRRPINTSLETATAIVKACVCLHNFIKARDDYCSGDAKRYCPPGFMDYEDANGVVHCGEWRSIISNDSGLTTIPNLTRAHNFSGAAGAVRDKLADFFLSPEGAVPWQHVATQN